MQRALLRVAADSALVALLSFAPAGTLAWPRAWILLAVLTTIRVATAVLVYRASPELLEERAKLPIRRDQAPGDRWLVLGVLATGFAALPAIAGYDRFHWHLFGEPGEIVGTLGLVLFALGWTLTGIALRTNAYAVSVVRLQQERRQVVVDTGPYGLVRHPFYCGSVLSLVGMSLWLDYLAALCAIVPIALIITRIRNEEAFLALELPDYRAYMTRVRYRLMPRVW